jgi:hypothetical protein
LGEQPHHLPNTSLNAMTDVWLDEPSPTALLPRPSEKFMKVFLLFALSVSVVACGDRFAPKTIESPRGVVEYKERVRPDDKKLLQGLREPTPAELDRLSLYASKASQFVSKYVPPDGLDPDLLENLDIAFAAWTRSNQVEKESPLEVESIVGTAFGQYCIERFPARWAVTNDSHKPEFALVGSDPDSLTYPLAAVRYRIEDRKTDFIGALYEALIHFRKKASEKKESRDL